MTDVTTLPTPPADRDGVIAWVARHLGHLTLEGASGVRASSFRGGQPAADAALAALDVTGYARRRSVVLPESGRGASRMSPYVRHGLITLPRLWQAVADAPAADRARYGDELMWQEYARHLYSRVGSALGGALRHAQPDVRVVDDPWPSDMACMSAVVGELETDGWLVNQTRMWLASQWAVRSGAAWRAGEDRMFAHLVDGSRAANRLGWQWTVGTGSGKPYGFSRWQVQKRAPALCRSCPLRDACPIEDWPDASVGPAVDGPSLGRGPSESGPSSAVRTGDPQQVWLTAESMGDEDPALLGHPSLPAVFVFDAPLLARLRLSGKRLVFLAETLGAMSRPVSVELGDPAAVLAGRALAATWTPVPGWRRLSRSLDLAAVHPWPWLVRPRTSSVRSFSAWRRDVGSS